MWFSQLVNGVRDKLIRVLSATRALEAALDCIIVIDHRGRIVEFNPAAERTFGHARKKALGCDFAELLIPKHLRDLHRNAGLIGRRVESRALRADGTEVPVEWPLSRVPAAEPRIFTAFVRDITEQKQKVKQL